MEIYRYLNKEDFKSKNEENKICQFDDFMSNESILFWFQGFVPEI